MKYVVDGVTELDIYDHLFHCSKNFIVPLSSRVDLREYANKIITKASTISAVDEGNGLIGMVAVYVNNNGTAHITNVSVLKEFMGKGIAVNLMELTAKALLEYKTHTVTLEVHRDASSAISLYKKFGFVITRTDKEKTFINMMKTVRNYDNELLDTANHKYAYNFDLDVMHQFMMRSFEPFFRYGESTSVLELGSYDGSFTKRLAEYFTDIMCVEASEDALIKAKENLKGLDERSLIRYYNNTFERATLNGCFDNIILTHVLEHIDDPVDVLNKINDEWLDDTGRLFLVCPNANAASRQIAVKMGLITHPEAITTAELSHGHKRTYTLNTLERDVTMSGLKVIHRSGIFFKALASYQLDKVIENNIISTEYLEGCYQLGQQYPDLCSSIFLVCERG